MKELEEVALFCAEFDDYEAEKKEVKSDQGQVFPYSRGFYLVGSLVAAMNPDDLDAMDESIPFTHTTINNILGLQYSDLEYDKYFQGFLVAQNAKVARGEATQVFNWSPYFDDFNRAPLASMIPAVQEYKRKLEAGSGASQPSYSGYQGVGGSNQYGGYSQPQQGYNQPAGGGGYSGGYAPQQGGGYQGGSYQSGGSNRQGQSTIGSIANGFRGLKFN